MDDDPAWTSSGLRTEHGFARVARLAARALHADQVELTLRGRQILGDPAGLASSLMALVVEGQAPLVLDDVQGALPGAGTGAGATAFAGVPVLRGDEVVGALGVTARTPRAWSDDEVGLLGDLAATVGAELERVRLAGAEITGRKQVEQERLALLAAEHDARLATEHAAAR